MSLWLLLGAALVVAGVVVVALPFLREPAPESDALHELDDNQLKDIGLSRADLDAAFLASTFFEDPSDQLTRSARNRGRNSLHRLRQD